MKSKRVFATILAALMLGQCLVGCSKKADEKVVSQGMDEKTINEGLDKIGFHKEGYPIVDQPITYSVFGLSHATLLGSAQDWEKNLFWTRLSEKTNLQFSFDYIISGYKEWKEQMNLAFASNDLPDIFFKANFSPMDEQKYGADGMIIPLEGYIEKYMPNLTKLMNDYPEIRMAMTMLDGHIYSLPTITTQKPQRVVNNYCINKAWLEKLNLPDPKTTDDFYNVLTAFKEQDPNGNGKKDEIPISLALGNGMTPLFDMMQFFGIQYGDNGMFLDADTQKMIYVPEDEKFKEMLKFATKLYADGLLDANCFTNSNDDVKAKNSGEDTLVGVTFTNSPSLMADGLSANYDGGDVNKLENNRKADYKFMTPLIAENGKQYIRFSSMTDTGRFAITENCKYPEPIMRFMDYFYTEEGGMYFWAGVKGEDFVIENNELFFVDESGAHVPLNEYNDVRKRKTMQPGGAIPCLFPEEGLLLEAELTPIRSAIADYGNIACPKIHFSNDVSKEVAAIATDINSYIEQYVANVITGKEDIDATWDEYIATLTNMGADQMVKDYQDAYNSMLNQ